MIGLCGPRLSERLPAARLSGNVDRRGEESRQVTWPKPQPELTHEMMFGHFYRRMPDSVPQELIRASRRKEVGRRGAFGSACGKDSISRPFHPLFLQTWAHLATKWVLHRRTWGTVADLVRHLCNASQKAGYNLRWPTLFVFLFEVPGFNLV